MSIYIQDMKIPTAGRILIILPSGRTLEVSADSTQNIFGEAQAVPVPPHGRLIESKAFLQVAHETDDFSLDEFAHLAVLVAATPTIIPADPAEEGGHG